MAQDNPFHEGELEMQRAAGVLEAARATARAFHQRLSDGAMRFVEQQRMAVYGSLDAGGRVWASLVFGDPGFLQAIDDRTLRLRRHTSQVATGDPLWSNLEIDPRVGILLIELSTRRRLRVNGNAHRTAEGDCIIEVERTYGNCPKYIQSRRFDVRDAKGTVPTPAPAYLEGRELNTAQQAWISDADTFFVASAHPTQGADASHRGGPPGFVKLLSPQRLRIPDFVGNNMFNTLGNFTSYPQAGLIFIDFEQGNILQLCGRPIVSLEQTDETGDTARYWEFEIETWRESSLPLRLEWHLLEYSPFFPKAT